MAAGGLTPTPTSPIADLPPSAVAAAVEQCVGAGCGAVGVAQGGRGLQAGRESAAATAVGSQQSTTWSPVSYIGCFPQ